MLKPRAGTTPSTSPMWVAGDQVLGSPTAAILGALVATKLEA